MRPQDKSRIADKWNKQASASLIRANYWFYPQICGHFNKRVCGKPLPRVSDGLHARLEGIGTFEKAVSVGCGRATKEQDLLRRGIVENFDLFDLSDARLADAEARYTAKGLADRTRFNCSDAFASTPHETYDLVYWNSSLHHMQDTVAAVEWSWNVLKPGGLFAMFEFTGPTRWQWTDENLSYINRLRECLPERLLPKVDGKTQQRRRPSVEKMIRRDPSEAADSENILPAIARFFPDAEVIHLGGSIYNMGLNGALPNFESDDTWIIDLMLLMDDILLDNGHSQHAVALGYKR
ncbi:class I SAM-dependent methyltransferase [Hyphomonas johnsonii]|uniref:Type 12 methyltransferase n=1 Tax=Hyphomonas johnsonii MHS-2 TaxID=1280950 RepID=A0A059FAK6_9PROT|nr:class I SAM-dependent methyltransferase [Hyphomonas johnsonii]KCZ87581.1 type 12 methyltransferase [Hyphomonas johnsonii MHS-2]